MDIANNFDTSVSSVFFTLKRLHETDIVQKLEYKGKAIYYPKGLRSEDVERAFSQLKHETRRSIFLHVLDNVGCRQKSITDAFGTTSRRQVIRHLDALVDAELLQVTRDGRSVEYTLGNVGQEIVIGHIDQIDPFLNALREKTGELLVHVERDGKMTVRMMNGDTIAIELGRWSIMNIDEDVIYENKTVIMGDGGEKTLIAIYNDCLDVASISTITGLPEKVVKAKVGALSRMGLVASFENHDKAIQLTHSGKKVAEKILHVC